MADTSAAPASPLAAPASPLATPPHQGIPSPGSPPAAPGLHGGNQHPINGPPIAFNLPHSPTDNVAILTPGPPQGAGPGAGAGAKVKVRLF